jgi:asparagine synthase (glutamine-hydrolysing)
MFMGITKLLPGHSLVVENGKVHEYRYWDLPSPHFEQASANHVYEEFESLLRDSVRIRLRSDVPVGAFLSGGLDSSSIVAIAASISVNPINTYTIGFGEAAFDERPLARLVAQRFATNHKERIIRPEDVRDIVEKLAWHYDEPFGDSSAVPTYLVSKEASAYSKVVLTGDGGDEVLSGYTIHQGEKFAHHYSRLPHLVGKVLIPHFLGAIQAAPGSSVGKSLVRARRVVKSVNLDFVDRLESKQIGLSREERAALIGHIRGVQPAREFIEAALRPVADRCNFDKLNYWLIKTALPDDMLCKVDRASMANSIETRLPFLDHRLVEMLSGISMAVKLPRYTRKQILRKTIGRLLPPELLHASKSGFHLPREAWLTNTNHHNQKLEARAMVRLGLVDGNGLESVLNAHQDSAFDNGNALWCLAMLARCCTSA